MLVFGEEVVEKVQMPWLFRVGQVTPQSSWSRSLPSGRAGQLWRREGAGFAFVFLLLTGFVVAVAPLLVEPHSPVL